MRIILLLLVIYSLQTQAQDVYINFWDIEKEYLEAFDEPPLDSITEDSVIRMFYYPAFERAKIYRIQCINKRKTFIIKTENSIKDSYYATKDFSYTEQVFELGNEDWKKLFELTNSEYFQLSRESYGSGSDGFNWFFNVRTSLGEHSLERWAPNQESDPIVYELGSTIERIPFNTLQLSGTIRNQHNEPIKKAYVKVIEPLVTIKSNKNGEFIINFPLLLLTIDELEIEISKKNYQTIEKTVSVGDLPTNLNIEIIENE